MCCQICEQVKAREVEDITLYVQHYNTPKPVLNIIDSKNRKYVLEISYCPWCGRKLKE